MSQNIQFLEHLKERHQNKQHHPLHIHFVNINTVKRQEHTKVQ